MAPTKIGVLGAGAYGTALAIHLTRLGHDTLIYARRAEVVDSINDPSIKENPMLKGCKLPEALRATTDLEQVVRHGELLLIGIPTPFVADTMASIKHIIQPTQILVSCSKGILSDTLETPHQILQRVLPPELHPRLAFLSGPSFAAEVARGLPTVVTIASECDDVAARVQALMSGPRFRCYRCTDVAGVELGGALKNVLAIGCGISDGLELGHNGRAALITRGLAEMTRLAVKLGAHPLTMGGLSGVGDLILTCTGDLSRNRSVGLRIGKGEKWEDIRKTMTAVAEGILTSRSVYELTKREGTDMPIMTGIYRVIHEGADPAQVLLEVMTRDLKPEVDSHVLEAARTHPATQAVPVLPSKESPVPKEEFAAEKELAYA